MYDKEKHILELHWKDIKLQVTLKDVPENLVRATETIVSSYITQIGFDLELIKSCPGKLKELGLITLESIEKKRSILLRIRSNY